MREKIKSFLITAGVMLGCIVLFFAVAVGVLTPHTDRTGGDNSESVPYYNTELPDSRGFLFNFYGGGAVFINFDFYSEKTAVIVFDDNAKESEILQYGYTADTVLQADYTFLAEFIDLYGGLELKVGEETGRYTGVQITDMLSRNTGKTLKKQIIGGVLDKILKNGFTKEQLLFIIENTETDLNYPDGYVLIDNLQYPLKNIYYVN